MSKLLIRCLFQRKILKLLWLIQRFRSIESIKQPLSKNNGKLSKIRLKWSTQLWPVLANFCRKTVKTMYNLISKTNIGFWKLPTATRNPPSISKGPLTVNYCSMSEITTECLQQFNPRKQFAKMKPIFLTDLIRLWIYYHHKHCYTCWFKSENLW